ncbi:hypothetical protein SRA_08966 [Streptococcus ratti FA-1 = DSM 20564]|uniref:Uncharacterized protein n=1 Tax=Streptococcus ratti FA-1 = DSM 20564 TaxID=699248 RepID=A0ABP2R050_STRRT|nr:hypothetical protein SRA_08966 [Streptococcus ratti FA-1 = DSM 20564]
MTDFQKGSEISSLNTIKQLVILKCSIFSIAALLKK